MLIMRLTFKEASRQVDADVVTLNLTRREGTILVLLYCWSRDKLESSYLRQQCGGLHVSARLRSGPSGMFAGPRNPEHAACIKLMHCRLTQKARCDIVEVTESLAEIGCALLRSTLVLSI